MGPGAVRGWERIVVSTYCCWGGAPFPSVLGPLPQPARSTGRSSTLGVAPSSKVQVQGWCRSLQTPSPSAPTPACVRALPHRAHGSSTSKSSRVLNVVGFILELV